MHTEIAQVLSGERRWCVVTADCLDILPTLPDCSIDLVVTDPPYGHNNNNGDLIANWEAALGKGPAGPARPIANDGAEANELMRECLPHWKRLLRTGCCCCCCCCCGGPTKWYDQSGRIENIIRPGHQGVRKIIPSQDDHPTPKPWQLARIFIDLHTQPGDVVLDNFAGRGWVGQACMVGGRRFIGIELDAEHAEFARRRIAAEEAQSMLIAPKPVERQLEM